MPGVGVPRIGRLAFRIGNAIGLVAAAFLLRQILVQYFGFALPPFITFYPAIMIVALLTGFWPGLLATTLSALLVPYWIFPPMGKWTILSVSDAVNLALFIGTGVLMSGVAERYRRDHARLAAFEQEQELREIRKQLQQISDYQRSLMAALDEGLAVCEMVYDEAGVACDYRILEVNKAYEKQTGLKSELVQGNTALEIFPDIERSWIEEFARITATGSVERFENFNHNTGRHYETFPCGLGEGKFILLIRDISERKRAEKELREGEERFRALVTASSDVVYQMSADWSEMRFLEGKDFIPDTNAPSETWLQKYIHPDDQPRVTAAISKAIRTGTVFELEHRVLRVDGRLGWTFSRAVPLKDENGEIVEWFGAASDITERKRAEDKLRWSEDQLRALAARLQTASERERLRIARELHDQLGLALTSVKMDLNWILRKHEKGENNWIPMVQDSIKAVDSTIALVRRLATELRPQMLDTAGLAAAIEFHVAEFQRRTGILCTVQVPEDNLGFSSDQRIEVFRICQEALTNIARHSQAKHVLVTLAREQDQAIMTVNDDGVGFLVDELVNTPALGLVGMRERAVLLGAQLHIESAPAIGSTISLRIPLEAAQSSLQETH
jgi:PAS domain S-box-containing protein